MAESDNCLVDEQFMIFAGSSEEDMAFATLFWKSVILQPPLESTLVFNDVQQRLKVAQPKTPQPNVAHQVPEEDYKNTLRFLEVQQKQEVAEKAQYLLKARRRKDIIALLRKQRAERIKISSPYVIEFDTLALQGSTPQKEKVSLLYKPNSTEQRRSDDELKARAADAEAKAEADTVRQLE
uniref:Cilia- and flagella-associated protein HOATZ n=1 Tax=Geotrypetes seraphini TaxID=260995 RepID=A0A6P8PIZ1_GEOSA|nr:UPF0722 protein C11orf88 homolog isoform X2 [Geotrypetes seraphini]